MHIMVTRTGGFAGIRRHAEIDSATHPNGAHLATLAKSALATPPSAHPHVPDGFTYTITVNSHTVTCSDPHLTPAQRELVRAVLGEGA
ncbi:protealysin inhibitor emfourin [Actinacidiphila sp. ITFR-21]|uniref:protealysin inhibitor emfourin n=1 Tax=Actinacidiphila sp. ITFR-21 TaxID=3075199 RepID=UPI00288C5241|nr:protealysin inhibitor emfourin [Streptomyces sp. ITFR-21]WNI15427.1 hypothetical protein RLT57_07720 [Streptomyces sp. ITFR-21]